MIAFNELLKNIDKFESAYKLMGLKFNPNSYLGFEKKLRDIQTKAEETRALCNKKCGEYIKLKTTNQPTNSLIDEINKLDKAANKYQKKQKICLNKIESKLKKLHNLPDKTNLNHIQIDTNKTESDILAVKTFLNGFSKQEEFNLSNKKFLTQIKNKIFQENELPYVAHLKNSIVVLTTPINIDEITDRLITYFRNNSISIIELSVKNIKKSSSREFFVHLKEDCYLKMEIKREFFAREYKVKFHNNQTDMTNFVNQINIIY